MDWLTETRNWLALLQQDTEQVRILFVTLLSLFGFSLALTLSIFANIFFSPLKKRIEVVQEGEDRKLPSKSKVSLLQQLGSIIAPKADENKLKVFSKLEHAGYRSSRAFAVFFGIKLILFALVPLFYLGAIALLSTEPVLDGLALAILSGVLAFIVPDFVLKHLVRRRQRHLRHALPDALDLMVVCAEAGLGLNAAIKRVADEMGVQHPELAEELDLVMMQTRAGMDSRSALKELERRTGLDDIRAFVTTLLQALRFGTSIAQSLRIFSDDMRDKRLQQAQEKAARLSLTMLMPIALCMLPMFFVILLGPSLISLHKAFTQMTGGG